MPRPFNALMHRQAGSVTDYWESRFIKLTEFHAGKGFVAGGRQL